MKHILLCPIIFLPLLFFILSGTPAIAEDNLHPTHKIRILFSDNVQAELRPCG